jgi:hypothetical protein
MSITDNRTLTINKAGDLDLAALAAGGLLPTASSKQFYERALEEPTLLQDLWWKPMGSYQENLPAMKMDDWFLVPGVEATALGAGDTYVPTITQPQLNAVLYKGKLGITREALKDNVQGGTLLQWILSRLPRKVARDMEHITVRSDPASATPTLAHNSGLLVLATTNVYAGGGLKINKDQLEAMIAMLANEYKQDVSKLRFYTSIQAERAWRNSLAERATGAGDKYLLENAPALYGGIQIKGCAAFQDNLGGANTTNVLLADPKGICLGFWEEVELRLWEDAPADMWWILCRLRFDVQYQDETAIVKATGVKIV